jgi:hypothetical protein
MEAWVTTFVDDQVNVPNGLAGLDAAGLVPVGRIPALPYLPITGGTVTGALTANGLLRGIVGVSSNQSFTSTTTVAILSTTGAGTCYLRPNGAASAAGQLQLSSAGVASAVNFTATSDYRLKKNVRDHNPRAYLSDLIEWKAFEWIETDEPDVGVIAQHVRGIAPEHVYEDADGMLAVDKASLALEMVIGLASRMRIVEEKTSA